jgi:hypothetical protein
MSSDLDKLRTCSNAILNMLKGSDLTIDQCMSLIINLSAYFMALSDKNPEEVETQVFDFISKQYQHLLKIKKENI